MQNAAHYIVFHPERQRQQLSVIAKVAKDGKEQEDHWQGNIWVDSFGEKNQDPYVLAEEWLYSYCHATQLRRRPQPRDFVQQGSTLIFCSGDAANEGHLQIDTVFTVNGVHQWKRDEQGEPIVPDYFAGHQDNPDSPLWQTHLQWPKRGHHKSSVEYTYTAKNGLSSYLPLLEGERVSIPIANLPMELSTKIRARIKGKYPVLLNPEEVALLLHRVEEAADTLVIRIKSVHHD